MLTEADKQILPLALRANGGFHIATEWYLRGFKPLPYQYAYHQLVVPNVTFLAGIATGKTKIASASNLIDCLSIPYFKALNTSVTAKQSELAFDMVMAWIEGNDRVEHLIEDVRLRPWPMIKFFNFSEYEFRTSGTDARFIRGTEYDRVTLDEAGLDFNGDIVKILRGRLRGVRPDGNVRLARLDVITSPTDALWLRERYERGIKGDKKSKQYVSLKARTRDNYHLTEEQISAMEAEYTDEMIAVEMDAEWPDYGLSMFPKSHINACVSAALNDMMYLAMYPEEGSVKSGWSVEEHPRHGITRWEMPRDPRGVYVMAGDPGQDDPPKRNAGCIGVIDISKTPWRLVYFDWTYGHGSYLPFLNSYHYALNKYWPVLKGLDTTGPQKAMQELAFEQVDIETDGINFSRDKDAALNALSLAISNHAFELPIIKGMIRQLSTFTRENDKKNDFPQDIVSMLAMLAFLARFAPEPEDSVREEVMHLREKRDYERTIRTRRRRRR